MWESQDSAPAVGMVEVVGDQESAVHPAGDRGDDGGESDAGDE